MSPTETVAALDPAQWAFVGMAIVLAVFSLGALVGLKL